MFQKNVVRSVKEIQASLLSRAFERGGEEEREKMQLLIEWRMAACHHENDLALEALENDYNLEAFNRTDFERSRGIKAHNLIAHLEGRKDRLSDNFDFKEQTASAEKWHHMNRKLRLAPLFDLNKMRQAPIVMRKIPAPRLHRSTSDPVYLKQKGGRPVGNVSSIDNLAIPKHKLH